MLLLREVLQRAPAVMNEAFELLVAAQDANDKAVRPILMHPYLDAWAAGVLQSSTIAADASGYLWLLATAAAVRAGQDFTATVPVTNAGHVLLPTLGLVTVGPRTSAQITRRGGRVSVQTPAATVTLPADLEQAALGWRPTPRARLAPGLVVDIDDADPHRAGHKWRPTSLLAPAQIDSWRCALLAAWELLREEHGPYAAGVSGGWQSLVPLAAQTGGRVVSAASRNGFGVIAASLPTDPVLLALTVVHEFQHVKLGGLLDMVPLCIQPQLRRYYAPWRDDPRPVEALLQGAYAHLGVADFWRVQRSAAKGTDREFAEREFVRWRHHTGYAIDQLIAGEELTTHGQAFVAGMKRSVEVLFAEPVPRHVVASVELEARAGEARWLANAAGDGTR